MQLVHIKIEREEDEERKDTILYKASLSPFVERFGEEVSPPIDQQRIYRSYSLLRDGLISTFQIPPNLVPPSSYFEPTLKETENEECYIYRIVPEGMGEPDWQRNARLTVKEVLEDALIEAFSSAQTGRIEINGNICHSIEELQRELEIVAVAIGGNAVRQGEPYAPDYTSLVKNILRDVKDELQWLRLSTRYHESRGDDPPQNLHPPEQTDISALDELFHASTAYRRSKQFVELMQFIARFPTYSPFNCFLLHMQNPHISFVRTLRQWKRDFKRHVRPDARPMIILAPRTPVLFVYDLGDTEGPPLPANYDKPFRVSGSLSETVWKNTLAHCRVDRLAVIPKLLSFLHAGTAIRLTSSNRRLLSSEHLPADFAVHVNLNHDLPVRYSTLAHELGHIYAGHLGAVGDGKKWKGRRGLDRRQMEIEAESICYLVCKRLGLKTNSEEYLAQFASKEIMVPDLSLDTVLHVVSWIEEMGKRASRQEKTASDKG